MNLPNQLTIGRIGLTFLMVALLTIPGLPWGHTAALLVFAVAGATDIADGRIARARNLISPFGQLMDPLADKILVSAAFITFVAVGHTPDGRLRGGLVPAWIATIIVGREFLVTGMRQLAILEGRVLPATIWGKHKMAWQTAAIVAILAGLALQYDILPLLWHGPAFAPAREAFATVFHVIARSFSVVVAVLTVISGGVYVWQCRDLWRGYL